MRVPLFGRKPSNVSPPPARSAGASPPTPGHDALLSYLAATESEQPFQRRILVGRQIVDAVCHRLAGARGVRAEDLLGVLASAGGFSCLYAAVAEMSAKGVRDEGDLVEIADKEGRRYHYGVLPNCYLFATTQALLTLALARSSEGRSEAHLAAVMPVLKRVVSEIGGPAFGPPVFPEDHRLMDLPINLLRWFWPDILEIFELYAVPVVHGPSALGFALQDALDRTKQAIDPALAAEIVLECAIPMAHIDYRRIPVRRA